MARTLELSGSQIALEMSRFVAAANRLRWDNPCLRGEWVDVTRLFRDRDTSRSR